MTISPAGLQDDDIQGASFSSVELLFRFGVPWLSDGKIHAAISRLAGSGDFTHLRRFVDTMHRHHPATLQRGIGLEAVRRALGPLSFTFSTAESCHAQEEGEKTLLQNALEGGSTECLQLLLECGVNPNLLSSVSSGIGESCRSGNS